MTRHAGLMVPLFSVPGSRSWGLGECPDLVPVARWLAGAGFDRLMLLPIGVVAQGETSPYGSASSMAIDPMFIALDDVEDFSRAGGLSMIDDEARAAREAARRSPRVDYASMRRAKRDALALAFDHFFREEWDPSTARAADCAAYIERERWWLDDWSIYAAIAATLGAGDWRLWPPTLRDREPGAIAEARTQLAREVLRQQYLQWIAEGQWQAARQRARAAGVTIFGDMPFMVSAASPDVWTRPGEYMFDVSLGVPPDAFSATGQDWGLPTYRWDRIAATGYAWIRRRAQRMAALYDGYRVDHLVGLFRTYGKPAGGEAFFNPGDEAAQIAQGETILRILIESGAAIIAEDLGVVPDFVRESMARLGVPGCKVLRWERHWHAPGQPFADPAQYPARSAAMTGTHDTETLAGWWQAAPREERAAAVASLAAINRSLTADMPWGSALRDALLTSAYGSGSDELFVPMQDVFGWTDRINVPATVGDHNWTWKLPWRCDELVRVPEALDRAAFCHIQAVRSGRTAG